ncbi:MAG: translocation/assembly module TamB [Acidobacteria bacterium]|nr:translocation/assembly module TamB [Acidobacteriota bacterium]
MTLKDLARGVLRHSKRAAVLALALIAAGIVTSLSVELGPGLRKRAESAATNALRRPMHIGALSIRLFGGRFVVHDIVIEGLSPKDAPFFEAREIVVSMPLWSLLRRELVVESVEISDWRAAVETWPGDRNNLPRLKSDSPGSGSSPIRVSASYVHAYRGQFTFDDHRNWSTVARNLDITVMKLVGYRGTARSSGGVITIGRYEPMSAAMNTWFKVDGGKILLERIELNTSGAQTLCTGIVDVGHWPEMRFTVRSTIQMPRIREIFWAHDQFTLSGVMQFQGIFRLFKGGHEVAGNFWSAEAGVNRYRFPDIEGAVTWTPWRFEVTKARSRFYGGSMALTYLMSPLGGKTPGTVRLDATYEGVDLAEFSDAMEFDGLRLAGRATGRNLLEWPIGGYSLHTGFGDVTIEPPPRVTLRSRALPAVLPEPSFAHVYGDPFPPLGHVPFGGEIHYGFGPEWIDLAPSHLASSTTYVEFKGRTAYGQRSIIPFHVTSSDWQESDRLLVGIMTAFGSKTRPTEVGGVGTFDGVLLNAVSKPRIEGTMAGRRMRAWDVEWGTGQGHVTVENSYADVADAILRKGNAEMRIEGRFSLGFPRSDGGEEFNARVTADKWPLPDLRHAFDLDEYLLEGGLSGEFHLYGAYKEPFGFGRVDISSAEAYGEKLASATAAVRFEGTGVRFDGVEIRKGTGLIRAAAHITWGGTYSFNADGRQIPVETVDALSFPKTPLTGVLDFSAAGSGVFATIEFDVTGRIRDLYIGDEGIGQVNGKIGMRGDNVNFEFQAGSTRLAASMVGTVNRRSLSYPGDITLRVTDTSLDPYARLFAANLSPFAKAIVSGTVNISGTLGKLDGIVARATIDKIDLSLFDYPLRNNGVIDIGVDQNTVRIHQFKLTGDQTQLGITGTVDLGRGQVGVHAEGDANLGILQLFSGNIRGSGRVALTADVTGDIDHPQIGGSAILDNGRLRHMFLPHAIENLNGKITFADNSIRFDEVVAKVGGGNVKFAGRVVLRGLWPSQLDVTANGESMELRYPAGLRSLVDADLALRGSINDPLLSGTVTVRHASYTKRMDLAGGLELAVGGASPASGTSGGLGFPLRFDVKLLAKSSLEIDNNAARITSSADLTLRGTLDRPLVFGRAEVEHGDVFFEGRRYVVTRGTFDFVNPGKFDPYFDVEAETQARAPGQTYRVTLRVFGNLQRIDHELSSDPPLPELDILSLVFGDTRSTQDAELRALQSPNSAQQTLIGVSRATRLLASPISSNVQKVVEQTFGVDTFQISPMLVDPSQQSMHFSAGARLTIGKRISDRVYVTYSRSLSSTARDQIILLEYDQSDRLSWILTQNEDKTYALDVRVRRVFR